MISAAAMEMTDDLDIQKFKKLHEIYEYAFQNYPEHTAFSCMGRSLTFRELDHYSQCLTTYLRTQTTLKPGDRIAIQLPNTLQFPIAVVAASRAGLILVNTNPLYTAREMRHQFKDSGVKGIIILANFCDKLQLILRDTDIQNIIITELGDMLPFWKRLVVNGVVKHVRKLVPAFELPQAVRWLNCMATAPDNTKIESGSEVAIILYTGGTTGLSKGAMLTHSNLVANMMQLRAVSKPLIKDCEDTIIAPLPLYHTYAFMFHCLAMVYAGNHSVLIPNPRDVDSLIKTMRSIVVNGFVGINTLYLALCRHPEIHKVDFSQLRFCGAGGMALTVSVAEEWERVSSCPIYEGYGLTECSPVVTVNPWHKIKIGTVGTAVPMTALKVVDDTGAEVVEGEKGELWIQGPQVMAGYWQNKEATQEAITADGWLKSGDYAQIDHEGYVRIVDRKKELIIVSGFNVFPSEVEEVVNSHPKVSESAAIGLPSEKTGEAIKLFVVRRNNSLTTEELTAWCRENLTAYKVPKEIVFADDLPKSNVGKILRRELREQEIKAKEQH
ncbi:MAG: AMP-binding protein [Pseudomonadales bacterium]|nr:AMP-binding protein [Pseudomonadales bacterium]